MSVCVKENHEYLLNGGMELNEILCVIRLLLRNIWVGSTHAQSLRGSPWPASREVCMWGNSWRKGVFCLVCIFHNQKMYVYFIIILLGNTALFKLFL